MGVFRPSNTPHYYTHYGPESLLHRLLHHSCTSYNGPYTPPTPLLSILLHYYT